LQPHWNRRGRWGGGAALLALALGLAASAGGEEPAAPPPAPAPAPAPVELDRLLKLPPASPAVSERLGGATKGEWRARFGSARVERDAAQKALETAQGKLGEAVTDKEAWQMGMPGASKAEPTDAPVSYALRQEIRRQRDELARCERHLKDLTIEADLAGVPQDWRE
jgi:hypothetical protein